MFEDEYPEKLDYTTKSLTTSKARVTEISILQTVLQQASDLSFPKIHGTEANCHVFRGYSCICSGPLLSYDCLQSLRQLPQARGEIEEMLRSKEYLGACLPRTLFGAGKYLRSHVVAR